VTDADPPATAQQLGESFAALVGGREWQVDDIPEALPVAEPIEEPAPSKKAAAVPLAEAANDPAIPPTPIQIIEALLFVGGPPLKPAHAADAIRGLTAEQFRDCVDALNRLYRAQNRPYSVVHGPTGYVLRVSAKYAAVKEKLYGGPREARLNQPALDVVAFVAYRQPVTKTEIDSARGADSGGVLRQLVRLGLITANKADGGEAAYSTTERFLEVFRLKDLDDLPQLGEPKRV
jgi:segregation and condensation protein B